VAATSPVYARIYDKYFTGFAGAARAPVPAISKSNPAMVFRPSSSTCAAVPGS
jgi:hypothetical protein